MRLLGAQIGGDLDCSGGQFDVEEGSALSADRAVVRGGVFLSDGFKATGEVRLMGAQISGNLTCSGGQLKVKEGNALSADGANVKGDFFFTDGFKAIGRVRLLGAQVGGDLDCGGGQFEVKEGSALSADRVVVRGGVFFNDGFTAAGEVRLLGAQISGNVTCTGGQLEVKEGDAFSADGANVKGDFFFTDGFRAMGQVRLLGAQLGGDLDCRGGRFEVKEGSALSGDRMVVQGDVFFNDGFAATGEVRLLGAHIGGNLECRGGLFEAKDGDALSVDRATIQGSVSFTGGFRATGEVRLLGAHIGGNLECRGGLFEAGDGTALLADRAVVKGAWHLDGMTQPVRVDASHMEVAVLVDGLNSWAKGSVLDGLNYGALGGSAPTQAKARLAWLRKQRGDHCGETDGGEHFRPQPWRQLQRVLREVGHAEDARQIGIAFEQQLRKTGRIGRSPPGTWTAVASGKRTIAQIGHWLFGLLSGYGYRPMRLMGWMTLVWLVCGFCYWRLALPPHHAIGPSDPLVFQNARYAACVPGSPEAASTIAAGAQSAGNWYLCGPLPAEYSTFSPWAYSLDIMLPLVDLGQEKAWGPLVPTPQATAWEELLASSPGHSVRWLVWLETVFGWIGSLLLVGIVSGMARRSED